jgi:hypothetical protein
MSKGRIRSAQMAGLLGGLIAIAAAGSAIAAALPLGSMRTVRHSAPITQIHYKGGSHCHANCAPGKKCLITVCHCKAGGTWHTVQGTSCGRRTSILPPNVTTPKCMGGVC